ncbi:hypothetical protein LJC08_00110 [Methanimicrococcus sp. OttesenSCG-928-J09]|nr:hypothetical protein [Methanimicrococcus sp. OttesenSCG-928-J09]
MGQVAVTGWSPVIVTDWSQVLVCSGRAVFMKNRLRDFWLRLYNNYHTCWKAARCARTAQFSKINQNCPTFFEK